MTKATVSVLALGGTIAMTQSALGGVVPTLTGESLVAAVPGLSQLANIDAQSFRQLPGAHLGYDDLEALADHIRTLSDTGSQGVVITQGTDTIEETAFALDCLLSIETPVIVTGAMRNPTVAGADGPANLLASVQVALSSNARSKGCLVVLSDEIHAARFVRKTHTTGVSAFSSPTCGQVGWISEGQVLFCFDLPKLATVKRLSSPRSARVALATVALGDDGRQIDALCAAQFDGMVVQATGGGHVSPAVADALEAAARRMPVVLASRTGAGNTLSNTYGFTGSEIDLQRRGLIRAGWLDGLKAKVLLTLLLRHGKTGTKSIAQFFEAWGGGRS